MKEFFSNKKKVRGFREFLYITPFLLLVLIFSYYPLYGWVYAFFDYKPPKPLSWDQVVGVKWFISMVENDVKRRQILLVLRNTLAMSGISLFFSWFPMIFAVFLNEIKCKPFQKFVQTVTTLPNFFSWILVYSIAYCIFNSTGAINTIGISLGWFDTPQMFLQSNEHIWFKMWLWLTWKNAGWAAIMYLAAISGIDEELTECGSLHLLVMVGNEVSDGVITRKTNDCRSDGVIASEGVDASALAVGYEEGIDGVENGVVAVCNDNAGGLGLGNGIELILVKSLRIVNYVNVFNADEVEKLRITKHLLVYHVHKLIALKLILGNAEDEGYVEILDALIFLKKRDRALIGGIKVSLGHIYIPEILFRKSREHNVHDHNQCHHRYGEGYRKRAELQAALLLNVYVSFVYCLVHLVFLPELSPTALFIYSDR